MRFTKKVKKNGVWYFHMHSKFARAIAISCVLSVATLVCIVFVSGYIAFSNIIDSLDNATEANYYALQTSAPYTIAIDPGHGGMDTGAPGIIEEIEVCMNTSNALFELLSNDKNYTPILTHNYDEDVSTTDRAAVATQSKASLLISIHANKDSQQSNAHGFECYATPPGRYYHEQSLYFAGLIVQGMAQQGHTIRGETGVHYLYYVNGGDTKKTVDSTDTKVQDDKSFGMLEKPLCPSVLVEQCFLSSQNDVDEWATPEGCERAARIYYEAICEYFNTVPL